MAPAWGKTRWVVERTFAWLHPFKRLRIRYERRVDLHHGLLQPGFGSNGSISDYSPSDTIHGRD